MKVARLFVCLLAVGGLSAIPAAAAGGAYPGTYAGKGKGVKAELKLDDQLAGVLRFKLKSACGKSQGKIELAAFKHGAFKGKRVSGGPHATLRKTTTRITPAPGGTTLKGLIRDSLRGGSAKGPGDCTAKRKFKAKLGATDAFVPGQDDGHYSGQSADGLPIAFDVSSDGAGAARITNLSADVWGECYADGWTDDDIDELKVLHLSGLEGKVYEDGEVEVDYAPDDDNEFEVYGQLGGGEGELEVWIDGYFDQAGDPDPSSQLYCDNDGPLYEAARD